jgi:pimeloyl-ACP methyl ester carboxylesterase
MPHRGHDTFPLRLLRAGFRHLGPHFPHLAGRWAYRLWFATRRFPEPPRERHWREQARTDRIAWRNTSLARYTWGAPDAPAILLIHGWNGRGTQMGAFAGPLVEAGFRAVACDAPGHGRSPGCSTHIFEYAEAIQALAQNSGPVVGAIAHSFGVPATARALQQGLQLPRLVAIAAPAGAEFLLRRFAHLLDIPDSVIAAMRTRIERSFGMDIFARLSTEAMLADCPLPGLIVHDRGDRDVPVTHAERLQRAWPTARLLLTEGLGHRRILRDPAVIAAAVAFLQHSDTRQPPNEWL